jgi:putative ABC transport system permease protein
MGLYRSKWDAILERTTRRAFVENNSPAYQKPFFIGMIGFIVGYALIEGFRNGIANAGTLFTFPPAAKVAFFVITALISISGTLIAIRRIAKLEPASVFRST